MRKFAFVPLCGLDTMAMLLHPTAIKQAYATGGGRDWCMKQEREHKTGRTWPEVLASCSVKDENFQKVLEQTIFLDRYT